MKIAIIPARANSKRIPSKNTKLFCGKPIITYSIEAAIDCQIFDKIIVTTDDPKCKEIAKDYPCEIFSRSEKNASDTAGISEVILEVLEELEQKEVQVREFALIYATAAFIDSKDLQNAYKSLDKCDSVLSVIEYSCPIQRALKLNEKSELEFANSDYILSRTQDLEKHYHDAGLFFWSKTNFFKSKKNIFLGRISPYIINQENAQDIDTESDWKNAEIKFKILKENNG